VAKQTAKSQKAPRDRRVVIAALFAVLFIALFGIVALAQGGIGDPSVPSGDVALVEDAPDGNVTQEEFDAALQQAALRQGVPKPPAPDSPQYGALRDAAMSDLLLASWARPRSAGSWSPIPRSTTRSTRSSSRRAASRGSSSS
jgi:hypothetical protein